MKASLLLALLLVHALTDTLPAQFQIAPSTTLVFASVDDGKAVLAAHDDYIMALGPFDRSAKCRTEKEVTEAEFVEFAANNVLPWTEAHQQRVESAILLLKPRLDALALPFPKTIQLILTTGAEEGNAAYTRGTSIILPTRRVSGPEPVLAGLIAHELFHVLSRANPELRNRVYQTIGFEQCKGFQYPAELIARKITNPDAPNHDHCVRIRIDGNPAWAIPLTLSSSEKFDPARGATFFSYLQIKFLLVERNDETLEVKIRQRDGQPYLVDMEQIAGYMEQIGMNSPYIFHPEEIVAENFKWLLLGFKEVPSPEVLNRISEALAAPKAG